MRYRKNQRRVLERLKDCMKEDSAKCTILGMSEFGLIEMTRQRSRGSLIQMIFTSCPYCVGSGLVKTFESTAIDIERFLKKIIGCQQQFALKLIVHPHLGHYLSTEDDNFLILMAEQLNAHLQIETDDNIHLNDFHFYSTTNNKKIDM